MENDQREGKNRGYSHYLIIILVAPFLYVFSIFPAVLIVEFFNLDRNESIRSFFEAFYAPVIWAIENSESFKNFMEKIAQIFGLE